MAGRILYEEHGGKRIDPALAQMIRFHTNNQDEFGDIVKFLGNPFDTDQLDVLLKHIGTRRPIQTRQFGVERKNSDGTMRCFMPLGADVSWTCGRIVVLGAEFPQTVRLALIGQPLSRLVEHPYLPDYLVIGSIGAGAQKQLEFHLKRAA